MLTDQGAVYPEPNGGQCDAVEQPPNEYLLKLLHNRPFDWHNDLVVPLTIGVFGRVFENFYPNLIKI